MRRRSFCLGALTAILAVIVHGQQAPPPPASFRTVRIAAGPRGSEVGGQFRLEQERTTFNRSSDTQVVVYFQWEGVPGVHRMAGRWRSPSGGLAISEFEYTARERSFGAYWALPVSPSTPLGTWSIEATIDGLPSGSFTFEITDSDVRPAPASQRVLAPADLYRQLNAAFVSIDRVTSKSGIFDNNGGFVIGPSRIATAFSAIDASDTLEMTMAGGDRQRVASLTAWDRRQDWAVIAANTTGAALPTASAPPEVGDRCYSMEGGAAGRRALTECTVVGRATNGAAGSLVVRYVNGRGVPGAPVLNESGEVFGFVVGAPTPGFQGVAGLRAGAEPGFQVVPLSALRATASDEAVSIQELRRRGVLMLATAGGDNVLSGGFARQIQRSPIRPIDQREEFSKADGGLFVFISWDPKERLRGALVLRVYDDNNRLLNESKPMKVDLKPGSVQFSQWELSVGGPARYRADVCLGDVPLWRGFYRVTQ